MSEVLKVENLEKYYGNGSNIVKAINRISFSVSKGEFIGIMGPSGSGKTTLLNCISTIDKPTSGGITIGGAGIMELGEDKLEDFRRDELGFVFQDFNLLDTLTGFENIALALSIQKIKPSSIRQRVERIAGILEISSVMDKFPNQMSGGQKQRVAAARAIVTNPSLILADEPTGALDSKASGLLLQSLEKLNIDLGATILMVTHDSFAASYAHRILFIKDGRIFTELVRGEKKRKEFFREILQVVTLLGGDDDNVL